MANAGQLSPARRWVTLGIMLMATVIVVLDNTVLNVAIPTILRDFHTTLPSLEWVITGYALTFATFLILGGRLGDLYGHRKVFIIGAALFGAGSLLASLSWNVASLVVGEAIIEGVGASLMLPATLALLSTTFEGRQRATAFAAWGAVAGSAAGLGPVLGGFLTTEFSWRWSFRINVIIAPIAIVGALLFIARPATGRQREPLDLPGASLIAVGMFLLVFALSEGGSYGWLTPVADFTIARHVIWAASAPISIIPVVFMASGFVLVCFYRLERRRERARRGPLFEFGLFEHHTFRYGLLTTAVVAMGQLGLSFVLALFLQESKHLSALRNGLWVLPFGLSILVAAPIGGRLTRRVGTTWVVRTGLLGQTIGLAYIATAVSPSVSFLHLLPGLICYGFGAGFAGSQLTNVVLSDVPHEKSGVASGANTTARQVGSALGIAVIGTVVSTETIRQAIGRITASATMTSALKARAVAQVHALGANYQPLPGVSPQDESELGRIVSHAVASGARTAMLFAAAVVLIGTCLSFLIPARLESATAEGIERAEEFAAFVPIDPEAELVAPPPGFGPT
jgi:EmrB/QacA subfamily drug resistance transporter